MSLELAYWLLMMNAGWDFMCGLAMTTSGSAATVSLELAYWLLMMNAGWDFMCGLAMLVDMPTGFFFFLAETHFGLWVLCDELRQEDEERGGRVAQREGVWAVAPAKLLFAVLVLQWGAARLVAAVSLRSIHFCVGGIRLGLLSYILESLLMVIGVLMGLMVRCKALAVAAMCAVCALVLLWAEYWHE